MNRMGTQVIEEMMPPRIPHSDGKCYGNQVGRVWLGRSSCWIKTRVDSDTPTALGKRDVVEQQLTGPTTRGV